MRFELFMRSIGQEYPDEVLSESNSLLNYNNGGHRQRLYPTSPHEEGTLLQNVRIRTETFGGLLYDMDTKAVFSMDHAALDAVSALLEGESFETLAIKPEFSGEDIRILKESLVKNGLCAN